MVWGAITYDSRSSLICIQGTMMAQRYVDYVLLSLSLPCLQRVPSALYQKNYPQPHTTCISQHTLHSVQMLPWPLLSPNLSPIGCHLQSLPLLRSEDELWQMVDREWRAIS
ncbi:hypothetical protein X975_05145, partial [Stegodyphus mimosarum]